MHKLFKLLTNKILITIFFFLLQVIFMSLVVLFLSAISMWIYVLFSVLSVIVCLVINSMEDTNPNYKLAWVIPILIFPMFGGALFITMGRPPKMKKKIRLKMAKVNHDTERLLTEIGIPPENANKLPPDEKKLHNFINFNSGYPLYGNTYTTYYEIGEKFHIALIEELKKAEKFIFLEFFIIEPGKFWNSVLEVLEQKAAEGIDVRVIYDDFGCLLTLTSNYDKKLREKGIKATIFNKVKPTFDIRLNNRTHRKIVVIDSKVAFTGGFNLADEYINEIVKFGHWKDTGMKFEGNAAWSFTVMFLRFWLLQNDDPINYTDFLPPMSALDSTTELENSTTANTSFSAEINSDFIKKPAKGYIQPLSGGPGGNHQIIENAFIQMIANADSYVYINTPYLVLDNEFLTVLCNAAKSGVDVRITMPHIPDKKFVFIMSRSFYPQLLKAGVKIYEYLPGFNHAKSIVSDDCLAYIGTCNLDYRSFYLHYECGAFLYETDSIADMKADYLNTLQSCKEISYQEATDVTVFTRLARSILRLFAPLM